MEADLAFLISALSMPNTPLTKPYSEEQLQEIRESFISLQMLLRHNALPVKETSLRIPAGGSLAGAKNMVCPELRSSIEESSVPDENDEEPKQTVSEIVRGSDTYSIWSLDMDTYETRTSPVGDGSSDVIVTRRKTHTSTYAVSAPVELVWSNSGYISQSTDSDTTITPDGHRFSFRK